MTALAHCPSVKWIGFLETDISTSSPSFAKYRHAFVML
jgi:hypothetical protein